MTRRPSTTVVHGDARELARAFEPARPTVLITDPVWPNRAASIFPGIDAPTLLRQVLEELVGKVSHVVLHVGCATDPRFAAAVPAHWPYWRTCWLRYEVPTRRGTVLIGSDVAWVFGPERYPEGTRIVPGECNALGRRGRGRTKHPCPRSLDHARWLVRWFSLPGECVLDTFCGSGTTLEAAREHGRDALGWDIEPEFCELSEGRLSQGVMFAGREP
jgi:hypothetical protein